MAGCQCSATPKVFLVLLSLLFWAAAGGLIFVGAWVYMEYNHYESIADSLYTLVPATIILAMGVFMFILAILGCAGAVKEQRCLLGVFFTVLLIIFAGMVSAAVMGYVYRNEVDANLQTTLKDALDNYYNDTTLAQEIDFMQEELYCCGVNNYTDWYGTEWAKHQKNLTWPYPESCCEDQTCDYTIPPESVNNTQLYHRPCYDYMKHQFLSHLGIVAGVAATLAVIIILGMCCSCLLICRRQSSQQYIGLTSPEHLRV